MEPVTWPAARNRVGGLACGMRPAARGGNGAQFSGVSSKVMLSSILRRLRRRQQSAVWNLPRKASYQQSKIESAVDNLREIDSLLVEQLGRQAPILREVRRDLERIIRDLNHEDDLTTTAPVQNELGKVHKKVRSINSSGTAFGIITILSFLLGLLSIPRINQHLFGSECPAVEMGNDVARNGSEGTLGGAPVGCIEATPANEELIPPLRPEAKQASRKEANAVEPSKRGAGSSRIVQLTKAPLPRSPQEKAPVVDEAAISLPRPVVSEEQERLSAEHGPALERPVDAPGILPPTQSSTEVLPRMRTRVPPDCPGERFAFSRAVVELNVLVAADGHIERIRVEGSAPLSTAREGIRAARRSRFEPGTRGGVPAEMWVLVRYDFSSCNRVY